MAHATAASQAKVAILLCTYEGQHYLGEQLESFAAQTHPHWAVWVSDDGSVDETHTILERYRANWAVGRLFVQRGPAAGFAANFLSLTRHAGIDADYFAYSDQDDVWEADKLERALAWLDTQSPAAPALYCSRTRYVTRDGGELGFSTLFPRPPSFRNALVQSIAGGNTMVFNRAARELLMRTPADLPVVSHDWWAYMLIAGCGGAIHYDAYPGVRYRQHGSNLAGQNITLGARLARGKALLAGRLKSWNDINLKALAAMRSCFSADNRAVLEAFCEARSRRAWARVFYLYRSGVYRQTLSGNLGLYLAALLNKL